MALRVSNTGQRRRMREPPPACATAEAALPRRCHSDLRPQGGARTSLHVLGPGFVLVVSVVVEVWTVVGCGHQGQRSLRLLRIEGLFLDVDGVPGRQEGLTEGLPEPVPPAAGLHQSHTSHQPPAARK